MADRAGRKGLDSTGRKFIYFLPSRDFFAQFHELYIVLL